MHTYWHCAAASPCWSSVFLLMKLAGKASRHALLLFVPLWLSATAYNMWVGVTQAGHSVADEAPIFALLFVVSVAVGAFFVRRLAE